MKMARRAAIVFSGAVVALVFGCEVIVPGDVPDYSCGAVADGVCPTGFVCDVASGKCIAPTPGDDEAGGDDGPSGVDGDAKSDASDAEGGGPLDLGQNCRFDVECKSKLCGTSTILTTTFTSAGPICTQTCCTSADCPSAFICFNGGTGGSYCVPAAKAQRTPPASGGKLPGASCVGSSECRSGLCSNTHCVDTCCLAGDCTAGSVCAVGSVSTPPPAHDEWVCVTAVGVRNAGTNCTDNTQCKVNNCVGQTSVQNCPNCPVCSPSCCKATDCTAWAAIAAPNGGTCAYGLSGSDQLKWCTPVDPSRGPLGTTCNSNFDCQSAYCDPEIKKCAATCCKDSDCGVGNVCKPSAVNTPFLRCVPGSR